ncbi:MAG: hypothetical protein V2I26_01325, partial [Halieaceae bacterium]|nr:hypothetical protein [Halieaceae bacterium]
MSNTKGIHSSLILHGKILLLLAMLVPGLSGCSSRDLPLSHTVALTEEFSAERAADIDSFEAYLQLEDRLFAQLDELVYSKGETGPEHSLVRYSKGSLADPSRRQP